MSANPHATRYTGDHEWLRPEADDIVVVGITDHAQQQLGDLVFVKLPDVGSHFRAGDEVAVIESVKAAGEIKAPLSGTVLEVNELLADEPSTVNEDPAGKGWFIKLKLDEPSALNGLMDEDAYGELLKSLD